jgi:microcystin-dependent protein
MPLETASLLNQLDPNNPTVTDGVSQGDDHLRLIKTALKGTFANFTGAAVASTEAQLDAGAAVAETGAKKLADAGAFFNTNSTDGLTNPAAGEVDVQAGGNAVVKLKSDKSASFQGDVSNTGKVTSTVGFNGPGAVPIGGTVIWWTDTLPDASWAWCNGGTYLRSNTVLWNIFGTTYGPGDGSTTANLPDLRDNVPVGKGTMGSVAAAGRIVSGVTNFVSSTLGAMFGAALHALTGTELPSHSHGVSDPGHAHALSNPDVVVYNLGGATDGNGATVHLAATTVSVEPAATGISIANYGGNGSHNTVQPSIVCNYIVRVA